jgi:SRSO17 transposase
MVARFVPFLRSFSHLFRSRSDCCAAEVRAYAIGLLTAKQGAKNLERMEECVDGFTYDNVHHAISAAPWDSRAVMDEVALRADGLLGGGSRPRLVLDDSGIQKKGHMSVGTVRQYIGRLGKIENGQVAVCASLASGQHSTLIDMRLYLPEAWSNDAPRCLKARIPEQERHFRTKAQLAHELVRHQRTLGTRFDIVSMDSGYGSDAAFLRALQRDGETYVAEVHSNQLIWSDSPWPHRLAKRSGKQLKQAQASQPAQRVDDFSQVQDELDWRRLKVRDSDQGWVEVNYLARRIWTMHEEEAQLQWLLIWEDPNERPNDGRKNRAPRRHYALSNAAADTDPRRLIGDALGRNVVERNFREAKSSVGMADYQVRSWPAWHHHMAIVMMAMYFLTQERMHQAPLMSSEGPIALTAGDIVFMMERLLPQRGRGPADPAMAERMLTKRIAKRERDQTRRRRLTRRERPNLWPDEDLAQMPE